MFIVCSCLNSYLLCKYDVICISGMYTHEFTSLWDDPFISARGVCVEHSYIVTWWVPEASIAFNASSERCSAVSMGSNFKVSCLTFSRVNFFVPNQNCIWSSKIRVPITNHKFGAIFLVSNTAEIIHFWYFFSSFRGVPTSPGTWEMSKHFQHPHFGRQNRTIPTLFVAKQQLLHLHACLFQNL